MTTQSEIREAFVGVATALRHEPALGVGSGTSVTRVIDGLRCEVVEGDWTIAVDMPPIAGGSGTAPTPGAYGRAALGSCLAMTYMMWVSKEGIAIQSLAVEVQADFDDGVLFGTSDGVAGYTEVRYRVSIKSQAAEADIVRVLDEADRHSAYRDVFARPQRLVRELDITAPD
jgi:uncharacterized OsmC-like protein